MTMIKLEGIHYGYNFDGSERRLAGDFEANSECIAREVGRQTAQGYDMDAQVECALSDFIVQLLQESQLSDTSINWVKWHVNQRTKVKP